MTFCKDLLHEAHAERLDAIKFVWERQGEIEKIGTKIGFLEAKPESNANLVAIDELYEKKEGEAGVDGCKWVKPCILNTDTHT